MKAFRVYALDEEGLVVRARLLEAKADAEAINVARDPGWSRWQLWRGTHLVADSINLPALLESRGVGPFDVAV